MSSPTSVDFLPRRLENVALSKRSTKRIKRIAAQAKPEPSYPVVANLQDLPSELMAEVLAFLAPNMNNPIHAGFGILALSQVSKFFRALVLSEIVWKPICERRWKAKVGFTTRMANAEAEATKDTDNAFIKGGYWYRKFGIEERDAARTTISRDELYSTTFSIKLWFQSKLHPGMKRIKGAVASGLDGRSLSDTLRFDSSTGRITGISEPYDGTPFFINDAGSIINLDVPVEEGTDPLSSLYVYRRKDWGWELRSQLYVIRSIDPDAWQAGTGTESLWKDYASSLMIQKRKKGTRCTRGNMKYKRREVPDVEEVKEFLIW